jgi:hypothetical protein
MRFSRNDLIGKALTALEELASDGRDSPLPKSAQLRFTLAFLSIFAEERWPFDAFWRGVTSPAHDNTAAAAFGRRQSINHAISGIYVQLGLVRPKG